MVADEAGRGSVGQADGRPGVCLSLVRAFANRVGGEAEAARADRAALVTGAAEVRASRVPEVAAAATGGGAGAAHGAGWGAAAA